jgi:Fe-S cluster assembly protein SufD
MTVSRPNHRPALQEADLGSLDLLMPSSELARTIRLAAHDLYLASPWPDRVNHLWRFTDPRALLPTAWGRAGVEAVDADEATRWAPSLASAAATIDLWPGRAPKIQLAEGVPEGALTAGWPSEGAGTEDRQQIGGVSPSLFRHLNTAAWNTGLSLQVAGGTSLSGPVHVRVHAAAAGTLPRLQIEIGEGAEVTLVEEHFGGGEDVHVVGLTRVIAHESARVRHLLVQVWEPGTTGHLAVEGQAGKDSDLLTVFGSFGGDLVKTELMTDLAGTGARSEMIGVVLGGEGQRFDHHTRHRHLAGGPYLEQHRVQGGGGRPSPQQLHRSDPDRGTGAHQ